MLVELVVDPSHPGMALAGVLGLAQETLRLGGTVIATEHLLMATLCDPVIRWKLKSLEVDMRDVQILVADATAARGRADHTGQAGRPRIGMTATAAALLVHAGDATEGLEPGRRPDPQVFSAAMIALLTTLLVDPHDTSARRIMDQLGLLEHTAWLLDTLADSAAASKVLMPRLTGHPA